VVTCEKTHRNNCEIISGIYFKCNHAFSLTVNEHHDEETSSVGALGKMLISDQVNYFSCRVQKCTCRLWSIISMKRRQ